MNNEKAARSAQLNAKRQQEYRARKAAQKMHEVRGIFATESDAKKIKKFAETLKNNTTD